MNYHAIKSPDMLNGSGLRTVIWVSGCEHNCPGCHNPETHDFNSGIKFTDDALDELLNVSDHDYIKGLTLTGGDPLHESNIPTVGKIIDRFKSRFPDKDIWVYTGYKFEYLSCISNIRSIISNVDVIVDGKFNIKLKDALLHFRGSSNQRIIDVKKSLDSDSIILFDC